jgi:hypothetical protein
MFEGSDHLITVRHGSARSHSQLRRQLEAAPAHLKHGVDYTPHAVFDFIVDGYFSSSRRSRKRYSPFGADIGLFLAFQKKLNIG